MPTHHSYSPFFQWLFWLGLLCHIGSYFLPVQYGFSGMTMTWGEVFWKEVVLGVLKWPTWEDYWYLLISLYLPPLTLLFSLGYFLRKRKILPTSVLILAMLLPNLIFPIHHLYRMQLGQQVFIIWGYYAWALSYGLFFWSFHQYKYRRVRPRNQLFDHLIEDE